MSTNKRRRGLWTVAVLVSVIVPAAALLVGTRISSPAQRAADAAPPEPSIITVKAERRVLQDVIVTQGDISAAGSVDVVPDMTGSARPVVSDVRKNVGDQLTEGDVVIVVSGRPIFVLAGSVPAYRDLQPGLHGPDVTQLRAALDRLGYSTTDADGDFGLSTQTAVRKFYADRGFTPELTSDDADDVLDQARRDVDAARRRASQAQQATASPPTSSSSDAAAQAPSSAGVAPAGANSAAQDAVDAAERKYEHLLATTGAKVPRGEVTFIPGFPASVTSSKAVLGGAIDGAVISSGGGANAGGASSGGAPAQAAASSGVGLMTISGGKPQVVVRVQPDQLALVHKGSVAKVKLPSGDSVEATVDSTDGASTGPAQTSPGQASGSPGVPVVITGDQIPREMIGRNTMVTIESAATSDAVLAVPSSAVSSTTDGTLRVTKRASGQSIDVTVDVGATAGGWVEIRPRPSEAIQVGDDVVVGAANTVTTSPQSRG